MNFFPLKLTTTFLLNGLGMCGLFIIVIQKSVSLSHWIWITVVDQGWLARTRNEYHILISLSRFSVAPNLRKEAGAWWQP